VWRKLFCPAPVAGDGAIQLFLNADRDPARLAADFHFRCLKRAIKQARPDDAYLCDGRDLLISLEFKTIVQLVADRSDGSFRVVWHREGANARF
jgi:hypothetical protein